MELFKKKPKPASKSSQEDNGCLSTAVPFRASFIYTSCSQSSASPLLPRGISACPDVQLFMWSRDKSSWPALHVLNMNGGGRHSPKHTDFWSNNPISLTTGPRTDSFLNHSLFDHLQQSNKMPVMMITMWHIWNFVHSLDHFKNPFVFHLSFMVKKDCISYSPLHSWWTFYVTWSIGTNRNALLNHRLSHRWQTSENKKIIDALTSGDSWSSAPQHLRYSDIQSSDHQIFSSVKQQYNNTPLLSITWWTKQCMSVTWLL